MTCAAVKAARESLVIGQVWLLLIAQMILEIVAHAILEGTVDTRAYPASMRSLSLTALGDQPIQLIISYGNRVFEKLILRWVLRQSKVVLDRRWFHPMHSLKKGRFWNPRRNDVG
jgi:hypothetical protein